MQGENPQLYKGFAVFEHCFDLGDERVVDLEGLHWTEMGFGLQGSGGAVRVDGVGLIRSACSSLDRGPLRGDFSTVEARRDESDRDVRAPARGALDTNRFNEVLTEEVDGFEIAGSGILVAVMAELDTHWVDDRDGEVVLMRVDPRDGYWHADRLLLEVMLRRVRDRQDRFGTSESSSTGSLQARSAPAGPTPSATGLTTGTRPMNCGVSAEREAGP